MSRVRWLSAFASGTRLEPLSIAAALLILLSMQEQRAQFRARVDLLTIDVVAVDREGQPVLDLRAEDFAVTVEGKAATVRGAELLRFGSSDRQVSVQAPAISTNPLSAASEANRGGRIIVILVDDLSIKAGESKGLLVSADRMVAVLDPDDLVGLTTTSGFGPVVPPTRDRAALVAALRSKLLVGRDEIRHGAYDVTLKEAVEMADNVRSAARHVIARECGSPLDAPPACMERVLSTAAAAYQYLRSRTTMQVDAYRSTMKALASAPAPRILILLSGGIAPDVERSETKKMLESLSRTAAETGVRVYGLTEVADSASVMDTGLPLPTLPLEYTKLGARRANNDYLTAGVQTVASAVGGTSFRVVGQADRFMSRILRETTAFYQVGVEIPATLKASALLGVKVTTSRPGVTVRSNPRAFRPTTVAVPPPTNDSLQVRLAQGGMAFGVPMALGAILRHGATPGAVQIAVEIRVPGSAPAPLTTAFALLNDRGQIVQSGRNTIASHTDGAETRLTFPLSVSPGFYQLRCAVSDANGNVGSVQRAVAAQLMKFGTLTVSDMVLTWQSSQGPLRFLATDSIPATADTLRADLEFSPIAGEVVREQLEVRFEVIAHGATAPLAQTTVLPTTRANGLGTTVELPLKNMVVGTVYTVRATILNGSVLVGVVETVVRRPS